MNGLSEDIVLSQITEQTKRFGKQLKDDLEGVYNVRKQYEIYFKYTALIIEALPEESVSFINDAFKEHGQREFCRIMVDPIHAFLLDRLSDELINLVEFNSEYGSFMNQLACEAMSKPWFDPDDEIWANRFSVADEFALKAKFKAAGRLDDYLDGEYELTPEGGDHD